MKEFYRRFPYDTSAIFAGGTPGPVALERRDGRTPLQRPTRLNGLEKFPNMSPYGD